MTRELRVRAALVLAAGAAAAACGAETGVEPPAVATVQVTSSLGALWDVGASVQLAAAATDAQGSAVGGVAFTWTSTDPGAVTVDAAGRVDAVGAGSATIRAEAGGVTGSLAVQVVDADLAGIGALASDPFLGALVTGTSSAVRARLQSAVADCPAGVGQGHLELIQDCIAAVRAEVSGATDPTDRAVLAVLSLFVDRLEQLLNL
jgi:hypothetical protein